MEKKIKLNTHSTSLRVSDAKRLRVAVGMSGGVDSAVAAALLKKQGYDVVGFMMKLWSDESCAVSRDNACCDEQGLRDAHKIADILDIPFYVVDVRKVFKDEIADYFIDEYKNLRTPNPCVKCNDRIKFGWLLDFAKKTGCEKIATGHYARILPGMDSEQNRQRKSHIKLMRGKDTNKDQSYFLYGLSQEQLDHIVFPLGEMTKPEVRALAKKMKLPVHEKGESQEICFIQEKDYREFLRRHIPSEFYQSGQIVNAEGKVLGEHTGLINYTIGQRKNVNQELRIMNHEDKKPLYVIKFDVLHNRLVVGEDKEVYQIEMTVGDMKWISDKQLAIGNKRLTVKIRYRHEAVPCKIKDDGEGLKVEFEKSQRAITPGQSAVFYSEEEVLGGGIIQ